MSTIFFIHLAKKKYSSFQKRAQCSETYFLVLDFLLIFETWSILYSAMLTVKWGLKTNLRHLRLTSDTREPIALGDSIQNHPGPGNEDHSGIVGGEDSHKNGKFKGAEPP